MTKSYVLDASALLIFLQKDHGFEKVSHLIKEAHTAKRILLMSAINWGETYGVILRLQGETVARQVRSMITSLRIELMAVAPDDAVAAAEIRVRHRLTYPDSFAAALAIGYQATLVTADLDFQKVARRISIFWLRHP